MAAHRLAYLNSIPLILLAASASYGVWQFQQLFVPVWVAALSAAAFESTYCFLALSIASDPRRATVISITAVVVSVVYNTLSSLFHLRPVLLDNRTLVFDGVLAILHGAPLAIVAYAVADLLLHRRLDAPIATTFVASLQAELAQTHQENIIWREECATQEQLIGAMLAEIDGERAKYATQATTIGALQEELAELRATPAPKVVEEVVIVAQKPVSVRRLAELTGKPETTLRRQLAQLEA